jgi:hypothetical protein
VPHSSLAGDAQPLNAGNASVTSGSGQASADTGTAAPGGGTTSTPTNTTTKKTFYTYTADVRFGKVGSVKSMTLERFRALPSSDNPIVIFMGVKTDGKTAVYMVSSQATTTGDGRCEPSDSSCLFLYMKKGEEQTIEAVDATGGITTYQLELRAIHVKTLDDSSAAPKAGASKAGPRARASLRSAHRGRLGRAVPSFDAVGF